ncbi:hypothetical protein EST38_g13291 [Candolleomyces aberdarensis]|uniref:Uncharacterized protein n=1 Tax=Candolleomyces aberdarensis TaxID=2316362 RepID=A0A4Q2D2L1_9AGAR|nr:hypothetical protein EST38_g13291 [Candolleomyces aberdarensis]
MPTTNFPEFDPTSSQEGDSFGDILSAMRKATPRDAVLDSAGDSQTTYVVEQVTDVTDRTSPLPDIVLPPLVDQETATDTASPTRASKRLLRRGTSLASIPPAGQGTLKQMKPAPRTTAKPPVLVLARKTVAAAQETRDSIPTPPEADDPDAPAKKRRKSTHTCHADAIAIEVSALKEEVLTLRASVQQLATNLETSQQKLKEFQFYVEDIKANHEPLMKMSDKIKSLDIEIRDTQAVIGQVDATQHQRHTTLINEIRPIFSTIKAFMDEARPAITTMGKFMTATKPRVDQMGTQGQDLRRLEDAVRATTSRLTELEGATADARALAMRPRLSMAPTLGNAFTSAEPLFPQAPVASVMAPAFYTPAPPGQPMQQQPAVPNTRVSAPGGSAQPQPAAPNNLRHGWAVKLGPINPNGAAVRDVLRSMFNPLPGGSSVLSNYGDPILTDNMDHITGKVRNRQAAHDLACFWNTNRKHPYHSVQAHVIAPGN